MQTIHDRLPLCRCFFEDRPAFGVTDANAPLIESACCDPEACLTLRPEVACLQLWIDLNA